MNQRLIVFIGPSGAGKDSLLQWLLQHAPQGLRLHHARRTITRPAGAGSEGHESVTLPEFQALRDANAFALHWLANDTGYGVRHAELAPMAEGRWVLLSGSRAHIDDARQRFTGLTVVHVGASPEVLRQRLLARGRETEQQVAERLARAQAYAVPPDALSVQNDSTLDEAGRALLAQLARRDSAWAQP